MSERDYILVQCLTRLRLAREALAGAGPPANEMVRFSARLGHAVRDVDGLIDEVEREVEKARDATEGEG